MSDTAVTQQIDSTQFQKNSSENKKSNNDDADTVSSDQGDQKMQTASSLYVGDLHPDVDEKHIFEKFSTIGPVLSIRVCRDMITRKSLGYAYVNFQNRKDAEKAFELMNFETLHSRPIRIMWSQRDPSLRKSGVGNIFIKNLDKSITAKELYDTFHSFGRILSVKISSDEGNNSRGYGFVHYETEEAAVKAIKTLNGMQIQNKNIYVGKFIPRSERGEKENEVKFTNCYIKNFGADMSYEVMMSLFEPYGEIVSAKIMEDETGKSKGFGFVSFRDPIAANTAVDALNNKEYNGHILYVGRAQKKAERVQELKGKFDVKFGKTEKFSSGVNLYVKNLDDHIDDDKLKKEFEVYGPITSAKVMTDAAGRSRGFGFVCFVSPEDATKAVSEVNGRIISSKPLYVAIAQKKEDRQAHLITQQSNRMLGVMGYYNPNINSLNPSLLRSNPFNFQDPGLFNNQLQYNSMRQNSSAAQRFSSAPQQHQVLNRQPGMGRSLLSNNTLLRPPISRPIVGPQMGQAGNPMNSMQMNRGPLIPTRPMNETNYNYMGQMRPASTTNANLNFLDAMAGPLNETNKQILGEWLYPLVSELTHNTHCGKITGMLLDQNVEEIKKYRTDREALKQKVEEAQMILEQKKRLDECPPSMYAAGPSGTSGIGAGDNM